MGVLGEGDFRRMLAWEIQRATRYQDFVSLFVVRLACPSAPLTVLRELVGKKLVELLRSSDVVGVVGEDLGVILVHTPDTDARGIAQRLQPTLHNFLVSEAIEGAVAVQISLVSFPGDATSADALLELALARSPGLS